MNDAVVVFLFLGFAVGAIYDIFRFFRLVLKKKWVEFLIDFLFFFTISPIIFLFLLSYNNGQVR
ncbi:MAG: spore cortex biosynthesis protein YabQ, partial [Eubacterium sp.]|nr:spore cortex biosynthesis protein YabQ [Eubacterium sp.]